MNDTPISPGIYTEDQLPPHLRSDRWKVISTVRMFKPPKIGIIGDAF